MGVSYDVRLHVADHAEDYKGSKKSSVGMSVRKVSVPTDPFTICEPRNQEIATFYVVQERRASDFEDQNCERTGRDVQVGG